MSLAALSLTQAAADIREGRIRSAELVADCLKRIDEVEPEIQAWAYLDRDHAMRQAEALDLARSLGKTTGPLHGVPVGIKDIFDTGDMPTELGSPLWAGRTPRSDAAAVARLRAAGAVIMGKTVTTEYAFLQPGKTRNPHDKTRTPGGSSSGSAAAVASFMVQGAIGSQTNGSVIRPAAFCGVVGYKPTHGLIPRSGALLLSRTLDHVGVFARSVEDAALMAECMAGFDADDPDTRPLARPPLASVAASEPPLPPRLAFVAAPAGEAADADTRGGFAELKDALGGKVAFDLDLGASFASAIAMTRVIMDVEMAHNLHRDYEQGRDRLSAQLRGLIERGRGHSAVDYTRAVAGAAPLNRTLDEVFNEYDAIVTPAALGAAPGLETTGNPVFCTLWTYLGTPAVSLPLLRSERGLPIGVQLVGRRDNDARLLRTAHWLVKTLGRERPQESRRGENGARQEKGTGIMTQFVSGLIGIGLLVAFMGFMLVWVKALPLIIIVVGVVLLLIYDFVQSVRHGPGWSGR